MRSVTLSSANRGGGGVGGTSVGTAASTNPFSRKPSSYSHLASSNSTPAVPAVTAASASLRSVTPVASTPVAGEMPTASNTSSIKVFVRVRPFNEREKTSSMVPIVKIDGSDPSQITVLDHKQDYRPRETYTFERCFWSVAPPTSLNATATPSGSGYASQAEVYDFVGRSVLQNAVMGFNGCIFAYGQTGSGKTFTMMGLGDINSGGSITPTSISAFGSSRQLLAAAQQPTADGNDQLSRTISGADFSLVQLQCASPRPSATSSRRTSASVTPTPAAANHSDDPSSISAAVPGPSSPSFDAGEGKGIIPRLTDELFSELASQHQGDSTHSFRVELQFYEVYNEKVYDLLDPTNHLELKVRQDPVKGPFVEHLTSKNVNSGDEIAKWTRRGAQERHTASTKMNDRSSRSHAIMAITLIQIRLDDQDVPHQTTSKLNLVDLAGSERTGLTGVEGQRFTEATKINLSLTTLGRVIDCLADLSSGKSGGFSHCPYRESNLTWLLMDSLGGNSKTTMIATISPSLLNLDEILQTLRYASRARQIVNKVVVNEDPSARKMKELTAEIERLNKIIADSGMCAYTRDYVEELEETRSQLRQEIADCKSVNANLRCELESAFTQLKSSSALRSSASTTQEGPGSPQRPRLKMTSSRQPNIGSGNAGSPFISRHAKTRSLDFTELAPSPLRLGEGQAEGATGSISDASNMAFQRQARDVMFLSEPTRDALRARQETLSAKISELVEERALLRGRLHTMEADKIELSQDKKVISSSVESLQAELALSESMMADHVQTIERLAVANQALERELSELRSGMGGVWLQHAQLVRDTVIAAEKEQREVVSQSAALVRQDLRTLLLQINASAEKLISTRIRDEMQKKHDAATANLKEEWRRRMDEAKEGYAAQLVQERQSNEKQLLELKQVQQAEIAKLRTATVSRTVEATSESQKALVELQAKYDAQQERFLRQIQQLQAAQEKERRLLKAAVENAEINAMETKQLAVADAVAKSRHSLEDLKKRTDRQISSLTTEREILLQKIADKDANLAKAKVAMEDQQQRFLKKEQQLNEWQRSLQQAKTLELSQLSEQEEAAKARHREELDELKATLGTKVTTFEAAIRCILVRCDTRLKALEATCARHQSSLSSRIPKLLQHTHKTVEDVIQQREASHERHVEVVDTLRRDHEVEQRRVAELQRSLEDELTEQIVLRERLQESWSKDRLTALDAQSTEYRRGLLDSATLMWNAFVQQRTSMFQLQRGIDRSQKQLTMNLTAQARLETDAAIAGARGLYEVMGEEQAGRSSIQLLQAASAHALHRDSSTARLHWALNCAQQERQRYADDVRSVTVGSEAAIRESDIILRSFIDNQCHATEQVISACTMALRQARQSQERLLFDAQERLLEDITRLKSEFSVSLEQDQRTSRRLLVEVFFKTMELQIHDLEVGEQERRVAIGADALEGHAFIVKLRKDGILRIASQKMLSDYEHLGQAFVTERHHAVACGAMELADALNRRSALHEEALRRTEAALEEERHRVRNMENTMQKMKREAEHLASQHSSEHDRFVAALREQDQMRNEMHELELKVEEYRVSSLEADLAAPVHRTGSPDASPDRGDSMEGANQSPTPGSLDSSRRRGSLVGSWVQRLWPSRSAAHQDPSEAELLDSAVAGRSSGGMKSLSSVAPSSVTHHAGGFTVNRPVASKSDNHLRQSLFYGSQNVSITSNDVVDGSKHD